MISDPNAEFKKALEEKPDRVIAHYAKFENVITLQLSNLTLDRNLLRVSFPQKEHPTVASADPPCREPQD